MSPSNPQPESPRPTRAAGTSKRQKLESAKTQWEIKKLTAEVEQITKPWKHPHLYFTVLTTVLSSLALGVTMYGCNVDRKLADIEVRELKSEVEALRKKKEELGTNNKDLEERFGRVSAYAETILEVVGEELNASFLTERTEENRKLDRILAPLAQRVTDDYDFFKSLLGSSNDKTKRLAGIVLSRLAREKIRSDKKRADLAAALLTALLEDKDFQFRRLAVKALGRLGKHSIRPLLTQLESATKGDRLDIVRALGEIGPEADKEVTDALLPLLDHSDRVLLTQVVWSLGSIGLQDDHLERRLVELFPADINGLLQHTETYLLCQQIMIALGKIKAKNAETVAVLARFFDVKDENLRYELVIALGKIGAPARVAVDGVLAIVNDRHSAAKIWEEAAKTLGRIGAIENINRLLGAKVTRAGDRPFRAGLLGLAEMDPNAAQVRESFQTLLMSTRSARSALAVLAGRRDVRHVPLLIQNLHKEKDEVIREELVRTLGMIGARSEAAVQALLESLNDEHTYVRLEAVFGLEKIGRGFAKVSSELARLRADDPDPEVRAAAETALRSLLAALDRHWPEEELLRTDPRGDDKHYKVHKHDFTSGYVYRIDLISADFDAFVYVKDGDTTLGFDDDSGDDLNARYFFEPAKSGSYSIWASTYRPGETGRYTLQILKSKK
ncbi:MAG: HEAT repeat domain-containing protein [Gemmataceae bacterium]|nr:HEAT repeat domain-containing protein [Gemmataceae bacterium]